MATSSADKLSALVTQAAEDDEPPAAHHGGVVADLAHESDQEDEVAGPCGCRCALFRRKPARPVVRELTPNSAAKIKPTAVVPSHPAAKEQQATAAAAPAAADRREANASAPRPPPREPRPELPKPATQDFEEQYGQLGPQVGTNVGRKTLVLDLDETLVHSSFRTVPGADIIISVELEGEYHKVYVRKRPGVDEFLRHAAELFEVVVYTASMAKYANPLLDVLDPDGLVASRLFREACTRQPSGYVKDLSRLGRNLKNVIIIDNSPVCYAMQPDNAIPIKTWRDDPTDQELRELVPILRSLVTVEDIPAVLRQVVWALDE